MAVSHRTRRRMRGLAGKAGLLSNLGLLGIAGVMLAMYIQDRSEYSAAFRPLPDPKVPEAWEKELSTGIHFGAADGILKIIEFMDLQCPYCATWAAQLDSVMRDFPNAVEVTFHHYPLTSHQFAVPAAIAAECAARQERFHEFQSVVLSQQRSFGTRSWEEFAVQAGVPDLGLFSDCTSLPSDSFPRIGYGRELGRRVGLRGTPLIWINGELGRISSSNELREVLTKEMQRQQGR